MFNKIIYVDENKEMVLLKVDTGNGFKTSGDYDEYCFDDWETHCEEYMEDDDIFFCPKNSFPKEGIYKIYGYDSSQSNTPEGYIEGYMVEKIEKMYDVKL